jgi:pyruvate kinase
MNSNPSIIITAGPSLDDDAVLNNILSKNVSWIRFNMSHGDHDEHRTRQQKIQAAASLLNKKINYFVDLQGPKMRVRPVENDAMELKNGDLVKVVSEPLLCTPGVVSIDVSEIHRYLTIGMTIFLHDGSMELKVTEVSEKDVTCVVIRGGILEGHKGVNIPDALIPIDTITDKDKADLSRALSTMQVDGVALSFVRSKDDVNELRRLLEEAGSSAIIISKIETKLALKNIESILNASDIVMYARGDLGVEIPAVEIPITQKELCVIARTLEVPVIVATQMLASMKESPIPTRAEMTDAIDALIDGATFLMLSDETTLGKHPIEAVSTLNDAIFEFTSNQERYLPFETKS